MRPCGVPQVVSRSLGSGRSSGLLPYIDLANHHPGARPPMMQVGFVAADLCASPRALALTCTLLLERLLVHRPACPCIIPLLDNAAPGITAPAPLPCFILRPALARAYSWALLPRNALSWTTRTGWCSR